LSKRRELKIIQVIIILQIPQDNVRTSFYIWVSLLRAIGASLFYCSLEILSGDIPAALPKLLPDSP
jgi:hypothetical protein